MTSFFMRCRRFFPSSYITVLYGKLCSEDFFWLTVPTYWYEEEVVANRQENGLMSREPHNSFSHTPKTRSFLDFHHRKGINEKPSGTTHPLIECMSVYITNVCIKSTSVKKTTKVNFL